MNVLVVGGTRFFGIPMVNSLLDKGYTVTLATRGDHGNPFNDKVRRVIMDKTDGSSVKSALGIEEYDVVIDKVAYSSNDVISLLENVKCKRYIQMSSCAVYPVEHSFIKESEFEPQSHRLIRMDRPADYAEGKRQAERAALEFMDIGKCTFVRYPVVMGKNDYTGRLKFYVEHICGQIPMRIDNLNIGTSYINESEAGEFISYLVDHPASGAVNGCSKSIISQNEIISYIESKSGKKAVISESGDLSPYDGNKADTSYDFAKAENLGYSFSNISSWIFELLNFYLSQNQN
ncbi:MAG: NAD-dependent epimerase/dehydratase family protein [Oscillospiraceae bacterium]|nr:NAD-dependent epimerase/dehydratase family protein [Oscillospiraceae bacterium]